MSNDFNMSMRKFLKRVGVTSQHELESAVQNAMNNGLLEGKEHISVKMVLTVEGLNATHTVEDKIALK